MDTNIFEVFVSTHTRCLNPSSQINNRPCKVVKNHKILRHERIIDYGGTAPRIPNVGHYNTASVYLQAFRS